MLHLLLTPFLPISILLIAFAASVHGEALEGRISYVFDGDTVALTTGGRKYRVRLQGIDAPEHDQPYGDASRDRLSRLVLNKPVRVETTKKDKYGRLLGKIWVQPIDCPSCGKTLNANLAMLTTGHAWWYRYYKSEQTAEDRGRYEFAEFEAKAKGAGLWQDDNPTPPWDWPRGNRKTASSPDGCRIKGNISKNGRIYHLPGQDHYDQTHINSAKGERWFCTEAEASDAGWRRARN